MAKSDSLLPPPSARSTLEESFFLAEDSRLLDKLRALKQMEENKQALSEVSGIHSDAVLTRLIALGTTPQTLAAIAVIPLIEVAWADGTIEDEERRTILECLEQGGLAPGGIEEQLVESWLERRPEPKLLKVWQQYVHGLCEQMTAEERTEFREEVLERARSVAKAAGGFAGLFKISANERDVLAQLEAAFC